MFFSRENSAVLREISYHNKFYWLQPAKICFLKSACNNYPSAKENSHKIFRSYGKWYSTLAQFFPFDSLFFHSFFWAVSKRFSKIMIKLELCDRIKDNASHHKIEKIRIFCPLRPFNNCLTLHYGLGNSKANRGACLEDCRSLQTFRYPMLCIDAITLTVEIPRQNQR